MTTLKGEIEIGFAVSIEIEAVNRGRARGHTAGEASGLNGLRTPEASLPVAQQDRHGGRSGSVERTGADKHRQIEIAILIEVAYRNISKAIRVHDGKRSAKSSVTVTD